MYNALTSAKQIWFYEAMALLILVTGIDLLFRRKNVSLTINLVDISLLTFYTYFFIRTVYTSYTPILYNDRFLNYSMLTLFYFIVKYINSGFVSAKTTGNIIYSDELKKGETITSQGILVVVLMLTGLVEAIWGLLQLYGITRSFHSGFKITGTFFNPAPYALYLVAIFPIALAILIQIKHSKNERMMELKIKELNNLGKPRFYSHILQFLYSFDHSLLIRKLTYYISLMTVISIILVLPATMNRASWLGVAAGSLFIFNYRYNLLNRAKVYLNNTVRKLCAVVIVTLLICLSGTGLYFLKKGSSDGRLLIWEVTAGKIAKKPLFGYGIGRFEAEYNNWQAEYFKVHPSEMDSSKGMAAGNTKYCFNEYLEMASELGIFGLLLFLTLIVSVFSGTRKALRPNGTTHGIKVNKEEQRTNDNKNSLTSLFNNFPIILIPSFLSLLVCAIISFPFYSLPTNIVFFLLLAILASYVKELPAFKRLVGSSVIHRVTKAVILFILMPVLVLLLFIIRQQCYTVNTMNEAVMLYQGINYSEACKSYSEIFSPSQYNGSYLQYYGKALNMNEEYLESIKILERATKYTSDEMLYTTLGDSFKELKRYSEAEAAYQYAIIMIPQKLYPRYLLANLYSETGQKLKARKTAENVLNKKVKVESTATEEIRQAMSKLIEKIKKEPEKLNTSEQLK